MAEKSGVWILGILILSFVFVTLVVDIVGKGGVDLGSVGASLFGLKTPPEAADPEKCECEYSVDYQDFMCNSYCGDLSGAFCLGKADCLS